MAPWPEERAPQKQGHQHLGQGIVRALDIGKGPPLPLPRQQSVLSLGHLCLYLVKSPSLRGTTGCKRS